MPRISAIDVIQSRDLSEALEWFTGDATTLTGTVETDTDPAVPQDLTGAVMTLLVEFYHAEVTAGHGRNASLSLFGLVPDEARRRCRPVGEHGPVHADPAGGSLSRPAAVR